MIVPARHEYLSTACWHAQQDGDEAMHSGCRNQCKFCPGCCVCPCHESAGSQPGTSQVDQARDVANRLLAIAQRCGVDLRHEDPDLFEVLRDDPAMFWTRGKGQPAGTWHPTNTDEESTDV